MTEILPWLIVAAWAIFIGGLVWFFAAGVTIKSGWQNGNSPLARYLDSKRRKAFNDQLPEALATMSNALRAGFSINQAFDSVVDFGDKPISEEFKILKQQLAIGMSFDDALESMSNRVGSDDLTLVTTAILIARKTGGNLTEIFDNIGKTIRDRQRVERKVRTLTAQGRLQGIVVSVMPFLLGTGMTILKPDLMIPFLLSWMGLAAVAAMIVLIVFGWILIRKIINIDV
ncbi:MAG: type II secretion system F family protein [Kiritimatiellae bacterium]|nr:type II secretion system F family protein [Kiritimatiellia bacterium]